MHANSQKMIDENNNNNNNSNLKKKKKSTVHFIELSLDEAPRYSLTARRQSCIPMVLAIKVSFLLLLTLLASFADYVSQSLTLKGVSKYKTIITWVIQEQLKYNTVTRVSQGLLFKQK